MIYCGFLFANLLCFGLGYGFHMRKVKTSIRMATLHVAHIENMLAVYKSIRKGHVSLEKLAKPVETALAALKKVQ